MPLAKPVRKPGLAQAVAVRLARYRGVERPLAEARILLAHVLGLPAASAQSIEERALGPAELARLDELVARRLGGEPVARLVGEREFWSLPLELGPETLVPRPDTETVVSAALAWIAREEPASQPLLLLDIGTGSGAILLALLSELGNAFGIGTDLARGAVVMARKNARRLGLAARSGFLLSNWAEAIAGNVDLLVANPPYICSPEIDGLPPEVRLFDPRLALDGGDDGLDGHRAVLAAADRLLDRGHGFFEVGRGQAAALSAMAAESGFRTRLHADLAGIDRVVEIWR